MIYIENNLEKQDVFIPRNDGSTCYVSPYDKGYQDGYQDGIEDCGDCPIQQKEVVLTATTETISPDQGYAGMDSVFVDARQLALEKYNEGYHEGEEDGAEEQKDKLTSTAFTQNGIYRREDGWNEVEVDVPKDINLGTLVESPQMSDITYGLYIKTFDPEHASVDGWGEIRLYMDTLIGQSKNEQKALMTGTTFTQNGLYRREDGWNEVIVEVPQTGTSCNLESKTETVTADTQTILPSSGYDGISEVVVDATGYGQDKYDEGFADGQASVPPCPPCPEIESGVTYGIGSGFTGATITPSSGYDGMAEVTITDNGYGQEKYDEGHGDGYNEGFSDGQTDILSGMTATAFTQNDTYTNASGWSAVTVNVPQTGSSCNLETKIETLTASTQIFVPSSGYDGMSSVSVDASGLCQDYYDEGYQDGLGDCPAPNLEQKSVTLTATTETVTPSQGYDGMDEVSIDASGLCQTYYNSGYTEGAASVVGTQITIAPDVWLSQYGTYYFTYDSATSISAMTVHFRTGGNVITYVSSRNQVEITGNYRDDGTLWDERAPKCYDSYDNLLTLVSNTYENGVGKLIFNDNIDRVGELWYNNQHIVSVTFPEGMRQFKMSVVQYCGLTGLTIPSTVEAIEYEAFLGNNITEVTFPDGCYHIAYESFMYNPVSSITFGSGTTYIGDRAFEPCGIPVCSRPAWDNTTDSLKRIYAYMPTPSSDIFGQPDPADPTTPPNPFHLRTGSGILYVPQGSSSYYQNWLTKLPSGWTISDTL